jgi:CRP-like cAMP-binding protein
MPDIRELKDQAAKNFTKGKFDKAATAYLELCRLEPKDMQLRVRLGDALVKKGDKPAAVTAYRLAAEAYAKEGFLPRAIAVCKLILEIDPSHLDTQNVLAQLYAKKSGAGRRPNQMPASAAATAPAAKPGPKAAATEFEVPIELDAGERRFTEGVAGQERARAAPAAGESSGLELDTDGRQAGAWKGQAVAWEAPAHGESAAAAPAAPVSPVAPAPAASDDVLFVEAVETPSAPAEPQVSLKDLDLGEPELLGLQRQSAGAAPEPPAAISPPPAAARWTAPAGPVVADSLAAALETAAGTEVPAQPAGQGQGWFAEPDGTRELLSKRRPTLADLEITTIDEDEEIELLSVTVDQSADASKLPEIPLFSDLSREAFVELASQCTLKRCVPGDVIVEQGTVGSSFFVVTSGSVKVERKAEGGASAVLARLTEGSFFGEMALLSGSPRAASVVAEDEAECLEISAELLGSLSLRYPHVQQALKKFCRQRLLANVMSSSLLFKPFDKAQRKALVEKFKARDVARGEVILAEGQPADGLYVVMAGEVEVRKRKDKEHVHLASLREGDVFGEISLLTKSAATATVAAVKRTTILRLPRETFDEVISTHPQVLALVSELSDERLRAQQSFERGGFASDGLLLL